MKLFSQVKTKKLYFKTVKFIQSVNISVTVFFSKYNLNDVTESINKIPYTFRQ